MVLLSCFQQSRRDADRLTMISVIHQRASASFGSNHPRKSGEQVAMTSLMQRPVTLRKPVAIVKNTCWHYHGYRYRSNHLAQDGKGGPGTSPAAAPSFLYYN